MLKLMATDKQFLGPVNLGNPNEVSVRELAELVIAMTGSRSELVFNPLPADDPKQRRPDITLARQKLDWAPKVKLRDGLDRTIAYFRGIVADEAGSAEIKEPLPIQPEELALS